MTNVLRVTFSDFVSDQFRGRCKFSIEFLKTIITRLSTAQTKVTMNSELLSQTFEVSI